MSNRQGYETVEALLEAESNGFVVVGISDRPGSAAAVIGPFTTREKAKKAQSKYRRRWKKEQAERHGDDYKIQTQVRTIWKDM